MATRVCTGSSPTRRESSRIARKAPRPVASSLPSIPPCVIGLPVITAGVFRRTIVSYSSTIQPMIRAFVFTSGAGMSRSGPIRSATART